MTAKPIQESEWIAELEQLRGRSDKGHTAQEIADRWGVNITTARIRLRRLHQQGRIVVGFRQTTTLDGRACRSPVYRIKRG